MDFPFANIVSFIDSWFSPAWRSTAAIVTTVLTHLISCLLILGSTEVVGILFGYLQSQGGSGLALQTIHHGIGIIDGLVLAIFAMLALSSVIKLLTHRASEGDRLLGGGLR
jgi:hypothetical protein